MGGNLNLRILFRPADSSVQIKIGSDHLAISVDDIALIAVLQDSIHCSNWAVSCGSVLVTLMALVSSNIAMISSSVRIGHSVISKPGPRT